MFCRKCGYQLEDGDRFCPMCSTEVAPAKSAPEVPQRAPVQPEHEVKQEVPQRTLVQPEAEVQQEAPPKIQTPPPAYMPDPAGMNQAAKSGSPKNLKRIILYAGIAAAALIVLLIVLLTRKPTVDLNKLLKVEFNGYDGYGTASAYIDEEAYQKLYRSKIKFKNKTYSRLSNALSTSAADAFLYDVVYGSSYELTPSDNLKNGDEVSLSWTVDQAMAETNYKCKIKAEPKTFTVEGLQEVEKYDVFQDVTLSFSGIAPNGEATLEYAGEEFSSYDFTLDKNYELKNGDTVTVTLDYGDMSYIAESFGRVPESTTKQYEVTGLDEYVEKYADLPEAFLTSVKTEAEDTIHAYVANSYNTECTLSDLAYAGYMMLYPKEGGINYLYMIYSGTVSHAEGEFSPAKVYYPVCFSGILKQGENVSYEEVQGIEGYADFDDGWYSTSGYRNPLLCSQELIDANREDYTIECGDGFEKFQDFDGTISDLAGVKDGWKEALQADARDKIESYVAEDYSENSTLEGLAYLGDYLLVEKGGARTDYIVVFSGTVSSNDEYNPLPATTIYFPVKYEDLVALPDDELYVGYEDGIQGYASFEGTWYSSKGYIDGALMYQELITSNRAEYNYEVSESLKQFGE